MNSSLTSISTRFINVTSEEVEKEIKSALKKIGEFAGVDRCYIYLFSEDLLEINNGYEWCRVKNKSRREKVIGLSMKLFSWSMKKYRNFEPLYISRLSDLPSEAASEKTYWSGSGVRSVISFPLYSRKKLIGIFGFLMERSQKIWKIEDISILKLLGEIFVNVLEWQKTENELNEYREKLEELVKKRTLELTVSNRKLQDEVSERINAEQVLRLSETNFRKLYEEYFTLIGAIPDMVLVIDPDLKILWVNRIVLTTFSLTSISLEKTCLNLFCNNTKACSTCPAVRSFITGNTESGQIKTKDSKYLDIKVSPIKDKNGNVIKVIMIASDITEKINLEKEAIHAAHLASLGELAAGVAHEINNPVNSIINYAQIIVNKTEKNSRENYIADEIISEGDRIAHIVKSLLTLSRKERTEKYPVHIQEIYSDTMSLAKIQMEKDGIKVEVKICEELPKIIAHPIEIQQVFLNILNNAHYALNKKYPPVHRDKKILISAEEVEIKNKSYVKISFYDYGCGISKNIQDKVMEPFFSTKPVGKGTGLGLSITYGIIEDHKGKMTVKSEEGKYTDVTVYLPVYIEL